MATKPRVSSGWGPQKLSGRLADFANATKDTILLGDIQRHMMREADKPSDRRQDIIHPSEMAKQDWCPLGTFYRIQACREADNPFLRPKENFGVQLLNIFDEGHYIHDKWQKRLRDMGLLWGNWGCIECGYVIKNDFYYDERCPSCKSHAGYVYREISLVSDEYLIRGHADGGVPRNKALIEIKSVGVGTARIEDPEIFKEHTEGQKTDLSALWKSIEKPFPSHVNQGQLYLHLAHLMNLEFDKIVFLYESKFNQGAKEFVVEYDPKHTEKLFDSAKRIKDALDGLTEPPDCPHDGCKDCEGKSNGTEIKKSGVGTEREDGPTIPKRAFKRGTRTPRRPVRSV